MSFDKQIEEPQDKNGILSLNWEDIDHFINHNIVVVWEDSKERGKTRHSVLFSYWLFLVLSEPTRYRNTENVFYFF